MALLCLGAARAARLPGALDAIRRDLADRNEANTCLALHALASVHDVGVAEALAEDVLKLVVSPYVVVG